MLQLFPPTASLMTLNYTKQNKEEEERKEQIGLHGLLSKKIYAQLISRNVF